MDCFESSLTRRVPKKAQNLYKYSHQASQWEFSALVKGGEPRDGLFMDGGKTHILLPPKGSLSTSNDPPK
jgi:hypothetical protein